MTGAEAPPVPEADGGPACPWHHVTGQCHGQGDHPPLCPGLGQQGTPLPPAAVRGSAVTADGRSRLPLSQPFGDRWVGGGPGLALS